MNARRPRPAWSTKRRVLTAAAALLLLVLAAWLAITLSPAPEDGPETEVVTVTRTTETRTVGLAGTIAPQQQANVSFAVPGTVQQVEVRVGDEVRQGQALARLDDRDLANAVALAQAQLSAAFAQLETIEQTDGATSAQIAAAEAQVQAADASLNSANTRLADATLTAPLSGIVAQVNLSVGDQVSGTGSLGGANGGSLGGLPGGLGLGGSVDTGTSGQVVIVVPDAWQLEASVGTADLPTLAPGQRAVVTPTGTNNQVEGFVDTVGIVATSQTGAAATFPVTIRISGPGQQLFSGASADAFVTVETVTDVLTVPTSAITMSDGASSVQQVTAAGTVTTSVTTGRVFTDRIEVVDGLSEGDQVLAPKGVVVEAPERPRYGPDGTLASPDPTGTP